MSGVLHVHCPELGDYALLAFLVEPDADGNARVDIDREFLAQFVEVAGEWLARAEA